MIYLLLRKTDKGLEAIRFNHGIILKMDVSESEWKPVSDILEEFEK